MEHEMETGVIYRSSMEVPSPFRFLTMKWARLTSFIKRNFMYRMACPEVTS